MSDENNYEAMLYYGRDFPKASSTVRIAQRGAYNCIKHRLVTLKETNASCFIPTGVGKSDIIRSVALGFCGADKPFVGVWVFSPSTDLRDQLKDDGAQEFLDRIGSTLSYAPFQSHDNLDGQSFRNGSLLDSYTTQFLNCNVNKFIKEAHKIFKKTGKMPIALIDEGHLLGQDASWGRNAKKLEDAGIPVVIVTGTPIRSDDVGIPGFELIIRETKDRQANHTEFNKNDPLYVKVRRDTVRISKYKLKAHYEYSYQRAWAEGVILPPSPWWIDGAKITSMEQLLADLNSDEVDPTILKEWLSDMAKANANRALRQFLLNPDTIKKAVEQCISSLRCRKKWNERCCAIVTTLCDEEESGEESKEEEGEKISDVHAGKIKAEFRKQDPNLKVLIATANQGCVADFKDSKKKYDVLIVKNMGTLGFNHPPIKTVLCLTNYRTLAFIIQLANRGCRLLQSTDPSARDESNKPYNHKDYDLIIPKDKGMKELLYQFQQETEFTIEQTTILLKGQEEKRKIEKPEDEIKVFSSYEDHTVTFDAESPRSLTDEIIEQAREQIPGELLRLGNAGLLRVLQFGEQVHTTKDADKTVTKNEHINVNVNEQLVDLNEQENILRTDANQLIKEINIEIRKLGSYEYSKYGEINAAIWTTIKRACGFSPAQKLNSLAGIFNFEKMVNACKALIQAMKEWPEKEGLDYHFYLQAFSTKLRAAR